MIYQKLYIGVLIILALMLFVCLIRAVKGPRVADRLMAVMNVLMSVFLMLLSSLNKYNFIRSAVYSLQPL